MILGVGIKLGEPNDLLGVYGLTVYNGRNLSVRSTGIKADTAAVKMTANGVCRGLVLGSVINIGYDNLECALVNSLHEADVEISRTAMAEGLLNILTNKGATCDNDLITAAYPEKALRNSVNELEVLLIVACAILVNSGLINRDVTLISLSANHDILPVILSCLTHFSANQSHGSKSGIELCLELKLHTSLYLR